MSKVLEPSQVKVYVPSAERDRFERAKSYQARVQQAHAAAEREVRADSGH